MDRRQREDLDRYITGNYGEDQFTGEDCACAGCGRAVDPDECLWHDGAGGYLCDECQEHADRVGGDE